MANTTPIFPAAPKNGAVTVVNADSTNLKTIWTAGANGGRVDKLGMATDDTAAHDVQLWINTGGTDYLVGTVNVAIGAGNSGTVSAKDVLADANLPLPVDAYGNKIIELGPSAVLKIKAAVAITSAKTMYVMAQGGDY